MAITDPTPITEEEEEEVEVSDSAEEEEESSAAEEEEEESEEIDTSRDTIRSLLEPFGKDQLISLLTATAVEDPTILTLITGTPAPVDPSLRKLFVHGLGWDTTTEDLNSAFSVYGEIEDCRAIPDRTTGRCKGFGFVLFKTVAGTRKALKEPQKKIGQRMTSCQLASVGPTAASNPVVSTGPALYGKGLDMTGFASQEVAPPVYGGGSVYPGVSGAGQSVSERYGAAALLEGYGGYQSDPYAALRSQTGGAAGGLGSGVPPYYGRY